MCAKNEEFMDWARDQGIEFRELFFSSFNGIRGIGLSTEAKAGYVVLSVPEDTVLRVLDEKSLDFSSELEKSNFVSEKNYFFLFHTK